MENPTSVVVISCPKRYIKRIRDLLKLHGCSSESFEVSPDQDSKNVLIPVESGKSEEEIQGLLSALEFEVDTPTVCVLLLCSSQDFLCQSRQVANQSKEATQHCRRTRSRSSKRLLKVGTEWNQLNQKQARMDWRGSCSISWEMDKIWRHCAALHKWWTEWIFTTQKCPRRGSRRF